MRHLPLLIVVPPNASLPLLRLFFEHHFSSTPLVIEPGSIYAAVPSSFTLYDFDSDFATKSDLETLCAATTFFIRSSLFFDFCCSCFFSVEHACVVDLLGRAGRLKEAYESIKSMKVVPDGGVWGALLGACKIHKNAELGKIVFDHLVELEPTNMGYYVLLTNIYQDVGKLKEIVNVHALIKKRGIKKEPGCSYVELKGEVHLFMADDHSHRIYKEIYKTVDRLEGLIDGGGKEKGVDCDVDCFWVAEY